MTRQWKVGARGTRSTRRGSSTGPIIATLGLVGVVGAFVLTTVLPIQARLPELMQTTKGDASWVVTITLLVSVVMNPIAGRLGDLYGKRMILVIVLAVLIAGCVISAVASSLLVMLAGRALQGVGSAAIPLAISILRDVLPPPRLPGAVGLVSATVGVGSSLGLPLGGLAVDYLDWRFVFWFSAAIGAAALALVLIVIPALDDPSAGHFDAPGALLLTAALVGILLAISKGSEWGWISGQTLGCAIGGLAVLFAWGWGQLRSRDPLVDLRLAARPAVLFTNLAGLTSGFALMAYNVAVPQFLTLSGGIGPGVSALGASIVLLVIGIVLIVVPPLVGRAQRRTSARAILIASSAVAALSFGQLLFLHERYVDFVVGAIVFGVGMSGSIAVQPILVMASAPRNETAAANGLNALARSLGSTVGASVIGAVLAMGVSSTEGAPTTAPASFEAAFLAGGLMSLVGVLFAAMIPTSARLRTRARGSDGI